MDDSGVNMSDEHCDDTEMEQENNAVYLPSLDVGEGEHLVHDESSYVLYHQAQTGAPCLSFDVIRDHLGEQRAAFPMTGYIVAGTQAEPGRANHVIVMKMSNLHSVAASRGCDGDSSDSDDDLDTRPELETAMTSHHGGVNRVRCCRIEDKHFAATWSERRAVHVWDLSRQLSAVESPDDLAAFLKDKQSRTTAPHFTFAGHMTEGFALDWSPTVAGQLLSGDCGGNIHLWRPHEGAAWHVDQRPFRGHAGSVEDLQWSPNERSVFASCSVDGSVKVWDVRAAPDKACMLTSKAHDCDVNVMSWSRGDPFVVTGGDEGALKVWDLRRFQSGAPVATFKHHTAPVTSVEWNPLERSVFVASSDEQITQWDLAVEAEGSAGVEGVPPQLLFVHQGQTDIKEAHWHPQVAGVVISTALDGFNVFKTISV